MGHPGLFPRPDLQGTSVSYVYKEAGGEGLWERWVVGGKTEKNLRLFPKPVISET